MSLTPQSIDRCDICGRFNVHPATRQTLGLFHGDQGKIATSVCLDCIKRFGFRPIVQVSPDRYAKLLDLADKGMAVRDVAA